jgi:DNA-directed RNA polymerase I subunit RPA1
MIQEDQAIKERAEGKGSKAQKHPDLDDEDVISEEQEEMMREMNDMDGRVKISKDVRGYEDQDHDGFNKSAGDDASQSQGSTHRHKTKALQSRDVEEIDNYAKILREAHSKYLQYLKKIDIDKEKNVFTVEIGFPLEFKKVLMLTLTEHTLQQVIVRQVPGIEKCTLVKPKKDKEEPCMVVQGINFDAFYKHQDIIDVDRIETNHSYALKSKYGVEAMRANILKEIQMVFGVYGISVDYRHLSLIADFMTFNGDYRAFNRIGMEESSSPFLKMSYETTMKYLVSSAQAMERDDMSAPSSAVVLGQVPRLGTGMFDILMENPA